MEREILVANTKTQKRSKITADVSTLGELKSVLREQGINYDGMSFTEGISNVQLNDDNSQLPHDINYKGTTTNNLVIILTNTTKNIASGASGQRANLFEWIKANNLSAEVVKVYGKNMTQVSTADLQVFVDQHKKGITAAIPTEEKSAVDSMADDILSQYGFSTDVDEEEDTTKESKPYCTANQKAEMAISAIGALVKHFSDMGILSYEEDYSDLITEIEDTLA